MKDKPAGGGNNKWISSDGNRDLVLANIAKQLNKFYYLSIKTLGNKEMS